MKRRRLPFSSSFSVLTSDFLKWDDSLAPHVSRRRALEGDADLKNVRRDAGRVEVAPAFRHPLRLHVEKVSVAGDAFEQEAERACLGVRAQHAPSLAAHAGRGRLEGKVNVRAFVVADADFRLAPRLDAELDALHVALAPDLVAQGVTVGLHGADARVARA